jgi:glycosyltransferase involved in cell wall biosynthesis
MRTLILIPAYREAARLPKVLAALRRSLPKAAVLVVDDGSPDATAAVARAAGAGVVSHPHNLGYGAALQTGYLYALRHGFEAVAQMDADGQHEPADLKALLAPLERGEADLVIGSRYLGGDRGYTTSLARRAGQRFFSALASAAAGQRLSDPTSGFKAVRGTLLPLFASKAFPADYPDADWLMWLARRGCRLREVPVTMYADTKGHSMHAGLKPLYYIPKVLLSFALNLLRSH